MCNGGHLVIHGVDHKVANASISWAPRSGRAMARHIATYWFGHMDDMQEHMQVTALSTHFALHAENILKRNVRCRMLHEQRGIFITAIKLYSQLNIACSTEQDKLGNAQKLVVHCKKTSAKNTANFKQNFSP